MNIKCLKILKMHLSLTEQDKTFQPHKVQTIAFLELQSSTQILSLVFGNK